MGTAARLLGIAGVAGALAAGGCSALMAPEYEPYSRWNYGGFTETEVQPGVFLVRFTGSSSHSPDRNTDFALLRAADICLQRGKNYLFLGDLAAQKVPSGYSQSEQDSSPPTLLYNEYTGLVVSCAESGQSGAWDANYLARSIRAKYSLT